MKKKASTLKLAQELVAEELMAALVVLFLQSE